MFKSPEVLAQSYIELQTLLAVKINEILHQIALDKISERFLFWKPGIVLLCNLEQNHQKSSQIHYSVI